MNNAASRPLSDSSLPSGPSSSGPLLLGIDAGGTHTDAALVRGGRIVARAKTPTIHSDLLLSISNVLEAVGASVDLAQVSRVNLSSTLATNAVAEQRLEPVGLLVSAGPGIDPAHFRMGEHFAVIPGATDFRGKQIAPLDEKSLANAVQSFKSAGLRCFAAVAKFSPRNAKQEEQMAAALAGARHISLGHRLSGRLNFPRRIATAYYNAAVWPLHNEFADAAAHALRRFGISAPLHILKADGGTMPLERSRRLPVESILSGPSASIMGILALAAPSSDCAMLDIGGSTTDIALFADGAPLMERDGIALNGRPSLVRALRTLSVPIGGDSPLCFAPDAAILLGPQRLGPSCAFGGTQPTLTDALNLLGHSQVGDCAASAEAVARLAQSAGIAPEEAAQQATEAAVRGIAQALSELIEQVNARPVYTLRELLHGRALAPERVYVAGGPAQALLPLLQAALNCPTIVPEHYDIANAVGAALAATTIELELYADTAKGVLTVPQLDISRAISQDYSLDQAREEALALLARHSAPPEGVEPGVNLPEAVITEASSFNMIEGSRRSGRTLRVRAQLLPGLSETLHNFKHIPSCK